MLPTWEGWSCVDFAVVLSRPSKSDESPAEIFQHLSKGGRGRGASFTFMVVER